MFFTLKSTLSKMNKIILGYQFIYIFFHLKNLQILNIFAWDGFCIELLFALLKN